MRFKWYAASSDAGAGSFPQGLRVPFRGIFDYLEDLGLTAHEIVVFDELDKVQSRLLAGQMDRYMCHRERRMRPAVWAAARYFGGRYYQRLLEAVTHPSGAARAARPTEELVPADPCAVYLTW